MGTDIMDCRKVAELIGIKTFINEFVAYLSLSEIIKNKVKFQNYTTFYNETGDWFWDKGNIILAQTNETLNGGILSVSMLTHLAINKHKHTGSTSQSQSKV